LKCFLRAFAPLRELSFQENKSHAKAQRRKGKDEWSFGDALGARIFFNLKPET
jgi:hypothetical protein